MDISDELPGLEPEPPRKTPIYRRERHLATAITLTEIEYVFQHKENPAALRPHHKRILEDLKDKEVLNARFFLSWCVAHLDKWEDASKEEKMLLRRAEKVSQLTMEESYKHYYKTPPTKMIKRRLPIETRYANLAITLSRIVSQVAQSEEPRKIIGLRSLEIVFDAELCLVKVNSKEVFLIPYSLFLCFADMCSAWFSVVCYSHLHDDKYPGHSLILEVEVCLSYMRKLLEEHRQKSYTLMKMWPSLVIGSILRDLESSTEFLDTLTKDMDSSLKQTDFYKLTTTTITDPVHAMLQLELAGLWKTLGHPIINMDASTQTWCREGMVLKPGLENAACQIDNMFKKELCRQFYKTHKRWPNLEPESGLNPQILACIQSNEWGETSTYKWDPDEFKHIKLLKNFEFNYHVDTIDIISDKAIIPRATEWIHEYDHKAFRTIHGHIPRGPPPTTKSVVMHFLTSEVFDCREILSLIDQSIIPLDWRVMVAVPKEREFKEDDARCFGKMTPEMRAYQVVTEKNIADTIFKYIKHQSMTLSEEQLTKTLIRMSHPGEGHDYINIIIDFSSWCTHFRAELLAPLFQSLDNLFGLNMIYGFTHIFPLISTLLFQDRYNPPGQDRQGRPMEGPRCVIGPEAWLEGLRQKGWTLATILIILRAAHMCGTTASLLGQGDNQVIVLRIPSSDYLAARGLTPDSYTHQFLKVLEKICEESGVVIKVPESWKSRRLLEYGRKYFIDGVQVSGALKKVSRLTSEANQTIYTTNTLVSGLYSSGAAIAGDDTTPIPAYMLASFEAALALWRGYPCYQSRPDEWMATLLLMNRSIGGYPTVLFPQFVLRATQDTLSLGLSVMKHLLDNPRFKTQVMNLLDITKPTRVDHLQLIKDPSSIPLNLPPQPENMFRRQLKAGLPGLVKNKSVAAIFGAQADTEEKKLKRDLLAIEPVNPKLLCKLWQLSNIGVREKVMGKFATARSIQSASLGVWIDEKNLISTIEALQQRTSLYYLRNKNRPFTTTLQKCECVTTLTQHTREQLWGLNLEGITMPTPRDKITLIPWTQVTENVVPSSIMINWSGTSENNCVYERGPHTPYIGSQTKVRARRAALQVLEVGSMVDNIKTLLELRSWVRGSDGLQDLLKVLVEEKTHLTLEELEPFTSQVYSGLLTHRLPCPALRRGAMWNGCTNILSWMRVVSDTAIHYAKQGTNFNICFQEDFLYSLSVLAEWYREYGYVPTTMAAVLEKKCCIWELPPETFTLKETTYGGLPLLKVIDSLTQVEDRHLIPTNITDNPRVSYTVHTAHKLAAWILHIRSEEFVTSLENRAISESVHASFLNLTEFKSVIVETLMPCLVFYLMIYDRTFLSGSLTYFDTIFSSKKTAYDVFLDTIMACGKAGELYAWAGVTASGKESDLRSALYLSLTRCVDEGYLRLMERGAFLTPDNASTVYPRMVKLVLRLLGEQSPPQEVITYLEFQDYVKTLPLAVSKYLPLRVVHTEEESVSFVRTEEALPPSDSMGVSLMRNPTGGLPPTQGLVSSQRTLKLALPYNMTIMGNSIMCALQGWTGCMHMRDVRLITLDDNEGEMFNILSHILRVRGFPHWNVDVKVSNLWERGPLACATDPCRSYVEMNGFFANITHSKEALLERIKTRPHKTQRHLIVHTQRVRLQDIVNHHYDREEGSRDYILFPMESYLGLEMDDPDWISLPGVVPPFSVEESPTGSQWILVGERVEDLVLQEEGMMAAYKNDTPGLSPHLVSVQTAISWNSEQARMSLLTITSCFNMFGPLIRILVDMPVSLRHLERAVKEGILERVNKMRQMSLEGLSSLGAAEEDAIRSGRRQERLLGAQIYMLYIVLRVVLLSDLNIISVASIRNIHCHRTTHSFKVCHHPLCSGREDAVLVLGKTEALEWANTHLSIMTIYSTIIDRLGEAIRYRGPSIRFRQE